jgi:DNA polymerase-3 subunit delta'
MRFSEVAGQSAAKQSLVQMWQSGRMPHALLLLGPEGTGGLPLALACAQYVFCEAKTGGDACGHCANCHKVQRLEHADLHFSFPAFGPKVISPQYVREFRQFVLERPYGSAYEWLQFIGAENKQGNITAEECRRIIEVLSLKSYEGGMKVQIIWRPEYLGKEGNILLKLIEEPPADTLLLFVAENTEEILPTILSRLQLLRLRPVPPADIAEALLQRGLADERRAAQIGQIAEGSFSEALRLTEQTGEDLLPALREWFNAIFTNNGFALLRFTAQWSKAGRESIRNLLGFALSVLESAVRISYLPEAAQSLPPREAEFAAKLAARRLPMTAIQAMMAALTEASYRIERNAYAKSVLLALSIQLRHAVQMPQPA